MDPKLCTQTYFWQNYKFAFDIVFNNSGAFKIFVFCTMCFGFYTPTNGGKISWNVLLEFWTSFSSYGC